MEFIQWVEQTPLWLSMLALFFAAWVEYVFPPFPGDTLLVIGGFLVAQGALPLPLTFVILTLGSVTGCVLAWGIGYQGLGLRSLIKASYLEKVETNYQRYGAWVLIVNRFIPGLRGAFMISAGLIKMPIKPILIWGTLSAILWNSTLIGLGYLFSDSLENLLNLVETYSKTVFMLFGFAFFIWFFFRMGRLRSCNHHRDQTQLTAPEKKNPSQNP